MNETFFDKTAAPADSYISRNFPPRGRGEKDDTKRIQRVIDLCPSGVVAFSSGVYEISAPLRITNGCSLLLNKSATLLAIERMDFVVIYDGASVVANDYKYVPGTTACDMNPFIIGGVFNGNGLASCISLNNYHHFTMRDFTCLNGVHYGLRLGETGHGYELIANNLYVKTTISGLAGNAGISSCEGDSHFTDCVVVDCTVGIELLPGSGSNRLTRCHVWGGPVPPPKQGELPEMLKDSVCFHVNSADALLRDCYADTGKIGFLVESDARLCGCAYFNNWRFGLDDVTCIRHTGGRLLVSEGRFSQTSPSAKFYDGNSANAIFSLNILKGDNLALPEGAEKII